LLQLNFLSAYLTCTDYVSAGDDGSVAAVVPATTLAYADSLRRAKPGTPGIRGVTPRQGARAASARGGRRNSARSSNQKQPAMVGKLDEAVVAKGVEAAEYPSKAPAPTAEEVSTAPVQESMEPQAEQPIVAAGVEVA
jgi:hypothetical protein